MARSTQNGSRVTIRDVARAAEVSHQTVSNVINSPEKVHPATLTRVREEIDRLGYRPSTAAQSLRQQRAGAVGIELNVLGRSGRSDVFDPFVVELTIASATHGCHMVPFASASERPMLDGYKNMVRTRLVDAFVIAHTHHGDPRPSWLAGQGVPFASYGRVWDDPTFTSYADVDGHAGTSVAVDHLVAHGYDRIGFLGWPQGSAVGDDRRRGWSDALVAHGIADQDATAVSVQDVMPAKEAAGALIDQLGRGAAIVCASDILALGVHQAVQERGWLVGADLGIVGFDDSPHARMFGLTSVAQPLSMIADHLLGLVHDQLGGAPPPRAGALFTPHIVARASSRQR